MRLVGPDRLRRLRVRLDGGWFRASPGNGRGARVGGTPTAPAAAPPFLPRRVRSLLVRVLFLFGGGRDRGLEALEARERRRDLGVLASIR